MASIKRVHELDERITRRMHVPVGHPLRPLVVVGAHLGDGPLWLLLWLGWAWWFRQDSVRLGLVVAWVASAIVGAIITYSIKFGVKRRRPQQIGGFYSTRYDKHAFPSGHATRMGTVAFWGSILFPALAPLFILVSLWCILSRAALGVHYLGDVLVGFLIGLTVSVVIWAVFF